MEVLVIKKFIKNRLKERTTLDGIVLIAAGISYLIFKPLAVIIAYAAIAYGVYTILKKD
jgi:hypothetical protein